MRTLVTIVAVAVACAGTARAQAPVQWTAAQLASMEKKLAGAVDPVRHLAVERLMDGASLIHRDGPSEAEVHQKAADFITVRAGEGEILIGGTIVDPRVSAPDELRGPSMTGGTRYRFSAGDIFYIPANTVHQFFPVPGKTFTVTIVKMAPAGGALPQGQAPRN